MVKKIIGGIAVIALLVIIMNSQSCTVQKKSSQTSTIDTSKIVTTPIPADVDTEFYIKVEKPATFKNGDFTAFQTTFLKKSIKYPAAALKKRQQGTVIIQYGIDCYGNLKVFSILKSSGFKVMDNEAVRALKTSPKWEPAMIGKKKVGQLWMIQIKFNAKTGKVEFV
jgi:TonB family protein